MMIDAQNRLVELLQSRHPVEGFTHNFYRYPARFAPEFAREAIMQFSSEGDCVLDAFMGGGTTIVEAISTGRTALGTDINPLAHFVATVKTTPLSFRDQEGILVWAEGLSVDGESPQQSFVSDPRLKNVPAELRDFLISVVSTVTQLEFPRQRHFARCALVKLGQWAIDCRRDVPSPKTMKAQLIKQIFDMFAGLNELVQAAESQGIAKNKITARRKLYYGTVKEAIRDKSLTHLFPRPKLVLTSPPYPGVHILYHRWQVSGRHETPVPYWLAGLRDGHGESFYTLGGRSKKGLEEYFVKLTKTFDDLRQLIEPSAVVIQLVAFSDPDTQLPTFLNAMHFAGYEEIKLFGTSKSERPFRQVPNRKWYTQLGLNQCASNEILLFHRPRP